MRKRKGGYPQVKWVTCINCNQQYEKEEEYSDEGCPICGSKEYDESDNDSYESWDW